MPDLDGEYDEFGVANLAEHTVVAHAVAPLSGQACCEPFAARAGVVASVDVLIEPSYDNAAYTGIELAELSIGSLGIE